MFEGTYELNFGDLAFLGIGSMYELPDYGYEWGYSTSSTDQHESFMPGTETVKKFDKSCYKNVT